jgi:hypothetical protein
MDTIPTTPWPNIHLSGTLTVGESRCSHRRARRSLAVDGSPTEGPSPRGSRGGFTKGGARVDKDRIEKILEEYRQRTTKRESAKGEWESIRRQEAVREAEVRTL